MIDVDHHHDNRRFGDANLVDGGSSSTAEILAAVFDRLGVQLTPVIAEALYVGLVTDTGRFQYRTTSPAALRLAAHLVEARRRRAQGVPAGVRDGAVLGKKQLLGRVLEHTQPFLEGGRLLVSYVTRDDLALVEGDEATTEGLIDDLREVDGVQVAALIREQVPPGRRDDHAQPRVAALARRVDVSQIARKSRAAATSRRPASRIPADRGDPRVHRGRGRKPAGRIRG